MRRRLAGLLAIGVVVVLLVVAGVVSIRIDFHAPRWAGAQFWTEAKGDGPLPPAFSVWIELARSTRPAIVNVSTRERRGGDQMAEFLRRFFEGEPPGQRASLGSGFVASQDGYVVTNNHVVAAGGQIVVKLNSGAEHSARVVGTDPATDLALLKIDATGLPVLPFGDSDRLQVGEPVMAIGNPFGLEHTVTTGIVSAKERFIGSGPYDDFIQTDASINPGNSGGPLIDSHGAVVGINTAIFSQSGGSVGIGFAIPINLAKSVLPQLRERGAVIRGWLGVAVRPLTAQTAEQAGLSEPRGAVVEGVVPGSPAERAGLQKGDVVVTVNDQRVGGPPELTRRIATTPPGTKVQIGVIRDRQRRSVPVELGRLPERGGPPPR
ncbi:MAG: trypsin-like peptidase domain-containing protein [Candidatus Rokubacteria bacterium]|nr:trypsin-like peptidase domain-containing protein [Candidatus Rokubacteria bacterium]